MFVMELHTNAHFEIRIPVQPQKGNETRLLFSYSQTRQACGKCYFIPENIVFLVRKGPNSRLQPKSVWVILVLFRTSSSFPMYFCSPGSSGRSRVWRTVLMMSRINIKMHLGQKACYFVSKVLSRLVSKPNLSTSLYCGLPELWTLASMCTDGSQLHPNLSFSHKWTHSSDVELLLQVQFQAEHINYKKGLCDCGGKCSCPHSEGKKLTTWTYNISGPISCKNMALTKI